MLLIPELRRQTQADIHVSGQRDPDNQCCIVRPCFKIYICICISIETKSPTCQHASDDYLQEEKLDIFISKHFIIMDILIPQFCFETMFQLAQAGFINSYAIKDDHELLFSLPLPQQSWEFRHIPSHLVCVVLGI